ncbi:helix-turn-helix domain-containing protein [Natronococcus wangiae]|uniref:helix-turn-helix domain-containing protein n=1 Tax=Natronococcus wangiae TaxID=3068275 RepID=UPI00273D7D83|nr:helix-turn-helix domain-containing protein [Natronococcus sp. AD5]
MDTVVVDRNRLTARQRKVLETASERGYVDCSKGANATNVAEELGQARSAVTEHLTAAQTKQTSAILGR